MALKFNEEGYPYEDLTAENKKLESRIKELDNSLSIALDINDKYQRENKDLKDKIKESGEINKLHQELNEKLKKRAQEAEGEVTIVKGIGINSPEMKEAQQKIKELEEILRSRDYTKQHDYKFLVDENKKLHKEVDELRRDNKKLANHVEDQMNRRRKAGM